MVRFILTNVTTVLFVWPTMVFAQVTADGVPPRLHPPMTSAQEDWSPRPHTYVEPAELRLPSAEELKTVEVRGREFHIRRTPAKAYLSDEQQRQAEDEGIAFGFFDRDDESLYFWGGGGGGRFSHERLVVEDCTFVIDFEPGMHPGGDFGRWDPHRAANLHQSRSSENCETRRFMDFLCCRFFRTSHTSSRFSLTSSAMSASRIGRERIR